MPNDFETQIDQIVVNTKTRLLAVTRQSISEMVEDMQQSVFKGGDMPVDTGFLRNTGLSSLNAPPIGPIRGRNRNAKDPRVGPLAEYDDWKGEAMGVTLSKLEIGDAFYFGWSAVYARNMEMKYGFLEKQIQNWQKYVDKAVQRLRDKK